MVCMPPASLPATEQHQLHPQPLQPVATPLYCLHRGGNWSTIHFQFQVSLRPFSSYSAFSVLHLPPWPTASLSAWGAVMTQIRFGWRMHALMPFCLTQTLPAKSDWRRTLCTPTLTPPQLDLLHILLSDTRYCSDEMNR